MHTATCRIICMQDSVCPCECVSVAQKQCCLSSVQDSRCEAGVAAARRGDTCEAGGTDGCSDDSYQVENRLIAVRNILLVLSKSGR